MKRAALFLGILFVTCLVTQAQEDIFKKHGITKEPLTLSKGKYKETFYNEEIMQVGTVLINTRTNKVVKFLEEDTTKFAYKAETTSRFLTVDPLAEEYYSWSPYVYVKNNPLKYIDPDGRDIKIYYQQGGKNYAFVFNGSNYADAPKNTFVQNALQSYKYNVDNGGGENMYALANSRKLTVKLVEAKYGESYHTEGTVFWDTKYASKTAEGQVYSPATIMEHEMDHAKSYLTDPKAHRERAKTPDKQYGNAEERRVITGSEAKTAQANGEFPKGYVRTDHKDHGDMRVSNPTQTTPIPALPATQTQQSSPSLWQRLKDWWGK